MKPESLFFIGIDQIKLPSLLGKGERFLDKYFLTNDRTVIRTLLEPVVPLIGSVEHGYLTKNCAALAYRKEFLTDAEYKRTRDDLHRSLVVELHGILAFTKNLWVIKDNAAWFDRGWLYIKHNKSFYCHNNTFGNRVSNSKGEFDYAEFSFEELRYARRSKMAVADPIYDGHPTVLGHKTLRYSRFTYFISGARQIADVGLKIAQYITALEALVSSSPTEVTHQVAERVACLLEPPCVGRIDAYKRVKLAYSIRSKVVHGAAIKESLSVQLRDISTYLDTVCRILMNKYVNNEDGFKESIEADDIDAFFLDRLLSAVKPYELLPSAQ
jgi:hypothetical protein